MFFEIIYAPSSMTVWQALQYDKIDHFDVNLAKEAFNINFFQYYISFYD